MTKPWGIFQQSLHHLSLHNPLPFQEEMGFDISHKLLVLVCTVLSPKEEAKAALYFSAQAYLEELYTSIFFYIKESLSGPSPHVCVCVHAHLPARGSRKALQGGTKSLQTCGENRRGEPTDSAHKESRSGRGKEGA